MKTVNIRKMLEADVAAVVVIEKESSIEPWSEKLFCDCIMVGYNCWVLENNLGNCPEIIGFGLLSCAVGEAHILNVVVGSKWRHQGLGKRMMKHLINIARELKADIVYLETRESNLIARELYKKLSFVEIGIRKGYYPTVGDGREDAVTLALGLL